MSDSGGLENTIAAREQLIERLQFLVIEQADLIERQQAALARVQSLADLSDWAQQSWGDGCSAASVLVRDVRHALKVERVSA